LVFRRKLFKTIPFTNVTLFARFIQFKEAFQAFIVAAAGGYCFKISVISGTLIEEIKAA
jgi:arylamine N-acetyltransferase